MSRQLYKLGNKIFRSLSPMEKIKLQTDREWAKLESQFADQLNKRKGGKE